MRIANALLCLLLVPVACAVGPLACAQSAMPAKPIVLGAGTMLDGQGHVLHNVRIVVSGSKIQAIETSPGPVDYDLQKLTVMPGWIDAHVHITWIFGKDGKNAGTSGTSQEDAYKAASNAWVTLMAGFTTVQSVGAPNDVPLRDAIAQGRIPGPRILTAVEPLEGRGDATGTPDEIRAFVRKQKQAGADLIKIFASKSIRLGGSMTLSQEQLNAACDEARKQGLRTLVHAYKEAVRAAAMAGCTEVEHGTLATDNDFRVLAEKGTYLDPQAGLVIDNYLQHKNQYLGTEGYSAEGFAAMEKILPLDCDEVRHAAKIPGLKIVFGTDAVAGAAGHNAEEFIDRVRCGVDPMTAMVSANSLGAEALGMSSQIGSIAPGLQADIIALDGDPLVDMAAVRRVVFVMKGGIVYKNVTPSAIPAYAGVQP